MVAQPMSKTPGLPISPFTEAGGLVVGGVLAHVMDASTVEIISLVFRSEERRVVDHGDSGDQV